MIKDIYREKARPDKTNPAIKNDSYIHFTPAMRLGDSLAGREELQGKSWTEIEPTARRLWEEKHHRPWREFSEIVRQSWARVKAQFAPEDVLAAPDNSYEAMFRQHYRQNYAGSNYNYDQFTPAYHYGYDLAVDGRLRHKLWADIEPQARRYWNSQSFAGPWESFKDAVCFAWQKTRQRRLAQKE